MKRKLSVPCPNTTRSVNLTSLPTKTVNKQFVYKQILGLLTGETLPDEINDSLVKSKEASGGAMTLSDCIQNGDPENNGQRRKEDTTLSASPKLLSS